MSSLASLTKPPARKSWASYWTLSTSRQDYPRTSSRICIDVSRSGNFTMICSKQQLKSIVGIFCFTAKAVPAGLS